MGDDTPKKESKDENAIDAQLKEASEKLKIDLNVLRGITPEDIQYLLDHCPFLQIVGPSIALEPQEEVGIIQSESGWDIQDYGDALASSPGRLLFGGGRFRVFLNDEDEEGGGGDVVNPGKGTVRNQAFVTACEMVMIGKERGWKHISIIDGHEIMKRGAWIKASEQGMTVDGFEPTQVDQQKRDRILQSGEDLKAVLDATKPKKR